jgi:short-subunit dehydrogenase|tara:strand:+ start:677 stop:1438 length:762 start_codon:yes stop_codon:yes gene_type:complete
MKTSLVTGGASGIGIEFVKLLLKDNYKVFIVDNDKNNIESLKDKLNSDNYESIYEDLCYEKSPDKIYKKLKKENIDILINNAGFGTYGKFYETDWKIEKRMLNLHVINTTHLTKLFLKDMIKKNDGKILNISSIAAFQPGPLMALYYATKAYILHFTEAISNEVKDKNITISVLCPGQTNTNFQRNVSSIKNKIKFNTSSPTKVAKYGYDALNNNVTVSIPGTFNKFLVNLNRFLPRSISTNIVKYIQEKNRN